MKMQPSVNSSAPISIAHLSDLHLTATDDGRRKEDRARHMNDNLDRRVGGVRIIGTRDSTVPQKSGLLSYKLYTYYPGSRILKATIRRVRGIH